MTWFEAEQLYHYLLRLESALDNWTLSRIQMQSEKARLIQLNRKLAGVLTGGLQPPKQEMLSGLRGQIQQCLGALTERLKY